MRSMVVEFRARLIKYVDSGQEEYEVCIEPFHKRIAG